MPDAVYEVFCRTFLVTKYLLDWNLLTISSAESLLTSPSLIIRNQRRILNVYPEASAQQCRRRRTSALVPHGALEVSELRGTLTWMRDEAERVLQ